MTIEQLRDFLIQFCMENQDISNKMHIKIDTSEGTLSSQYEDDDTIITLKVCYDTFRVEQTIKEKKIYRN